MNAAVHTDEHADRLVSGPDTALGDEVVDRGRPNVSGDLPTVFLAAPVFRRTVTGYDRFQVDTYVQWAEDELATAQREHEHLMARHLSARAELEQARQLLTHSAAGGELLGLSHRMGAVLAAAADEADGIRAEARSARTEAAAAVTAARAEAERTAARAAAVLAGAESEAGRLVADAATRVEAMISGAGRIVDDAEQASRRGRAEVQARLEEVRAIELRATEQAALVRQRTAEEAAAARLQVRDEVVGMLSAGRDERRRADADADATRDRLDRAAADRRAALLGEVAAFEHRRSALRAEVELLAERAAGGAAGRPAAHLRRVVRSVLRHGRFLRVS